MACVTLKRPLEWVDPSMSANSEPSGSSSPTSMIISNSPPHPGARSPKRLCLQGFNSSSPSYNSTNTYYSSPSCSSSSNTSLGNAFHTIKPISSNEIVNQIRDEVRRLRIIKRPKHSKLLDAENNLSNSQNSSLIGGADNKSPQESMNSSPSSSPNHGFGINSDDLFHLFKRQLAGSTSETALKMAKSGSSSEQHLNDKPLFSYSQVLMIVERLFRNKEDELRKQYEELLSKRLSDQYDQFVKFNTDQMQRYDRNNLPSYLS